MKILIKILTIFTVLCVLACSQTFENVSNNNQSFDKNTKVKGLLIMNINNSSRTITNELTNADIHSAVLTANDKVVGNWNGENVIEQINNDKSIMLDVGKHNLVLCIKNKDGNILATAQTEEYIEAGSNKIYFYLESVISGNGSFEVTFSWQADGVDSIKAGLYDSETDKEVTGYEMKTLAINEKTVVYATDEIPAGQYILKIDFYDNNGESLKIYTEILQVEAYRKTTATRTFTGFNTNHTIEYILTESWKEGFTPITIRNAAQEVKLPTIENINTEKDINSHILKWYTTETFDKGTEIIKINTGTEKDMKLYGKIEECIKATVDNFSEIIQNLPDGGPYNVVVTGELTNEKLSAMATCIEENSTKMINLDLGNTTGLTEIKDYTFQYCNNLTSIIIPEKVTEICYFAFFGCSSLASVTIPDSVTTIGAAAFYGCSSLTSVIIPDSVTTIDDWAFQDCSSLTSAIIGNSVTSIGEETFYGCSSLESVTIGNSVASIGERVFYGCSSLTSVTIPDSVTYIGNYAFRNCSSLTSVVIPDSVTSIGDSAFRNCSSLTSVVIPDSVTSIGNYAFGLPNDNLEITVDTDDKYLYSEDGTTILLCDSSVTNVVIPENVTIQAGAFDFCRNVETIVTGDTLTSLFYFPTDSLKSITIGNGITEIRTYEFCNCSSLESVTIGNGVASIGDSAFWNCSSLTSVVIPDSVTTIDDWAFRDCSSLTSVTIPDSVTTIGERVFDGCSSLTSVIIPDSVTTIGKGAFGGCSSLTSVIIPDNVTFIDSDAFYGCSSLESVTIGDGITEIGPCTFYECKKLKKLVIGNSVTSINNDAFTYLSGNQPLDIPIEDLVIGNSMTSFENLPITKALKSITIGTGITFIDSYAFYENYNLTSITIPDSVIYIGDSAFYRCFNLKTVNYRGTQEQWEAVIISKMDNSYLTGANINYNYTGE